MKKHFFSLTIHPTKRGILFLLAVALLLAGAGLSRLPRQEAKAACGQEGAVSLPVVMYHHLSTDPARLGKYVLSPAEFEEDLLYLKKQGFTAVSAQAVLDFVQKSKPLPEKPVLLTIDDGYESVWAYGFPLLKKHQCPAVINVVGSLSEAYSQSGDHNPAYTHLTWEQINAMAQSGLAEFGNHSYDLHRTPHGAKRHPGESSAAYRSRLTADTQKAQALLTVAAGKAPAVYAYPFGFASKESDAILRETGFSMTLSCEERVSAIAAGQPDTLFFLGRFNRPHGVGSAEFFGRILPK